MKRRFRPTDQPRSARGSASVLVAGVMGVVVVLGGTLLVVAGYAVAYHRARSAADLVAVSAAAAFELGEDACAVGRRTATANSARLVGCDRVGDQIGFVVSVRVSVATPSRLAGLPSTVEAVAHAGPAR